jgi:methionyl-tRNA formyltransferase
MNKNITVLVDNDSWIIPYAEQLIDKLKAMGYPAEVARNHESVNKGWINFMLGCVRITPDEVLARNEFNLVVHESDLPKGRGFAPMAWQILEGQRQIPICLIEASPEVDSGDIWLKRTIFLDGTELNQEWRRKQGEGTIELCLRFVQEYRNLSPKAQSGDISFYKRRTTQDSELDINRSIREQFDLLRIVDNKNYPGYFIVNNQKYLLKIEKC